MDRRKLTGEVVRQDGLYICEAGEKRTYQKGQTFDVCPITDKGTRWRKIDKQL
jgi:hypothetical protein